MAANNYLKARIDVDNGEIPVRIEGELRHTTGMRSMLERPEFAWLRTFNSSIDDMNRRMVANATKIVRHLNPLKQMEQKSADEAKELEVGLELKQQATDTAKSDLAKHENAMRANGIPVDRKEAKKSAFKLAWKNWLGSLLIFLGIEGIAFAASYVMMNQNLNNVEMITRLLTNAGVFVIIDFLIRNKNRTGRSAFLVTFVLIYACMLLAPLLAEYFAAEVVDTESLWQVTADEELAEENAGSVIDFLVRNAGFIFGVLAIINLIIFLGFYNKTIEKKVEEDQEKLSEQETMKSIQIAKQKVLVQHEEELDDLKQQVNNQPIQTLVNFEHFKGQLSGLDSDYQKLEKDIAKKHADAQAAVKKIMEEVGEYKSYFEDLYKDTPNALVTRPEWPTNEDIMNYYNLKFEDK